MPFSIVRDEIASRSADVVIVPANAALAIDGGAGLAVGRVAGLDRLQAACDEIGGCAVGQAVATPAFDFPADHIVHAVGPVWDASAEAEDELAQTYRNALSLAASLDAQSVVLPLISSGAQGCPSEHSLHVCLSEVRAFLEARPEVEVTVILFDEQAAQAGASLFPGLAQFIDDAYSHEHENLFSQSFDEGIRFDEKSTPWQSSSEYNLAGASYQASAAPYPSAYPSPKASGGKKRGPAITLPSIFSKKRRKNERSESAPLDKEISFDATTTYGSAAPLGAAEPKSLEDLLDSIDAPFSTTLLAIIDERGLSDAEVYKRANLSRQHFSKIRSNPQYRPTKRTALALCVALELDLDETEDLLRRAGFTLSHASKADLIVEWFIERENYDIFAINEALYLYDQPLLAG